MILVACHPNGQSEKNNDPSNHSNLSTITLKLPSKEQFKEDKRSLLNGYRLIVEPRKNSCLKGQSTTQVLKWESTTVANVKITFGCDYQIGLQLGSMTDDQKDLSKIFFANFDFAFADWQNQSDDKKGKLLPKNDFDGKTTYTLPVELKITEEGVATGFGNQGGQVIPEGEESGKTWNCETIEETIELRNHGSMNMPAQGRMVIEAHLASSEESFNGNEFPSSTQDQIDLHLESSCKILTANFPDFNYGENCSNVYNASYKREWCPQEGGDFGQGSSASKPPIAEETFYMNMYWTSSSKPKPGTKFLVRNSENNTAVVTIAGYETGPASTDFVGGLSPEVHFYLKSNNDTKTLNVGRLQDQSLPVGPVKCQ